MTGPRCVSPLCWSYGEHWEGCNYEGCRGCAPRLAAIGLLCAPCCDNLGRDALAAAVEYAELEQDLVSPGGGPGGGGSSNPFPSLSFDPRVAETRATIHHTLTSWCLLVGEESGYSLPEPGWRLVHLGPGEHGPKARRRVVEPGIGYLGAYLDEHRIWLASHPAVDEACDELASLVHVGVARQDHHSTASTIDEIGVCPLCPGKLKAVIRRESSSPTEVFCEGEQPHRWQGERQLAELGRIAGVRDGWLSAREIARRYERPLGTVQRWASTERWRKTEDGQRPVLFHPQDVEATVTRLSEVTA